jgi:hypothetical protein
MKWFFVHILCAYAQWTYFVCKVGVALISILISLSEFSSMTHLRKDEEQKHSLNLSFKLLCNCAVICLPKNEDRGYNF